MKIKHILEGDVIDIAGARRNKVRADSKAKLTKVAGRFKRFQEVEREAKEAFIPFSKMIGDLKQKVRLFGFESIDDVFYFLALDARLPKQNADVREWYEKLESQDKKKFLTIVHNRDRILKVLKLVQEKLRNFQNHWSSISKENEFLTSLSVFDNTSSLDMETNRDIDTLQRVGDIATMLDS